MADLLAPWTGPFGGVPPLDQVELPALEQAMRDAMAKKRAEAEALSAEPDAPTFENTVAAFQRIGSDLDRVETLYDIWSGSFSSKAFRALEYRLEPELAALRDTIRQDGTLFSRIETVAATDLNEEQTRLCKRLLRNARNAGAHLDAQGRGRVSLINQRLSTLYTTFNDNLLADEEGPVTFLEADQLTGLSEAWLAAAKVTATERGQPDKWAVSNTRSSMEPFLTESAERSMRETVWRTFYQRGDGGGPTDNKALIAEILSLRLERAKVLGYSNHAEKCLKSTMAGTPARALELMRQVWKPALAKFERECSGMQALADEAVAPWDVRFYAAKVRQTEHDFNPASIQAHYELEHLREGMFWAATERFGWQFSPIDVPVPHVDVRVWAIHNADGSERGLLYFDPYARRGKRSGAWMSAYRVQQRIDGEVLPLVSNNCNFVKPPGDQPTLLTQDEARTLFHEFGHAMHGLSSNVTYPDLAGTRVSRDFVEFPSQLNEHWLTTSELLDRFARHHETGEPPDPALLSKMTAAANSDNGFRTLEFLASAIVDMELHTHEGPIDIAEFERDVLSRWGLPDQVVMRHRTPQFGHLFSDEGYSAQYYSYLWADVLTADAAEAFAEQGFYDPALSKRLWDTVLSVGATVDAAEAYRAFRGRDPEPAALLRERGLV